jgi:hypothetical protein
VVESSTARIASSNSAGAIDFFSRVCVLCNDELITRSEESYRAQVQGDQNISVQLMIIVYSKNPHTIDDLKMAIIEYIRNVDRAILNTVFENTVGRVNKCLETSGRNFEHYS